MNNLARISGIAVIVCLVVTTLTLLSSQEPKIRLSSTTATESGFVIEGEIFYERGFLFGVANYSISEGWKHASSERISNSIKSGETVPSKIEWSVSWAKLASNYIVAWVLVGAISWWWNQKEPHELGQSTESEQGVAAEPDRAGG